MQTSNLIWITKKYLNEGPRRIGQITDELGISMIYMGLESGNDGVLAYMKKGVTAQEMIEAAHKVKTGRNPTICYGNLRFGWQKAMEGSCQRYRTRFIRNEARLYRIAHVNDRRRSSVGR